MIARKVMGIRFILLHRLLVLIHIFPAITTSLRLGLCELPLSLAQLRACERTYALHLGLIELLLRRVPRSYATSNPNP